MQPVILVVEDNPITLKMLRVALEIEEFGVLEARDGATALDLLESAQPDAVLQDYVLPDMGGDDLVRAIRSSPRGRDLPVVLLTGLSGAHASDGSFSAVLQKPVEPSRLVELLRSLLAGSRTAPATRTQRRVLVVDDDPINRKLAHVQLTHAGFAVTTVDSAQAALVQAGILRPDVVLADVLMPGLDGFQLCKAIRSDPALHDLPIVLVSAAYAEAEDRALATRLGASDLVFRSPGLSLEIAAIERALRPGTPEPATDTSGLDQEYVARLRRQVDRQLAANQRLAERGAIQAAALSMVGALTQALANPLEMTAVLGDVLVHCLDAAGLSTGLLFVRDAAQRIYLQSASGLGRVPRPEAEACFGHPELLAPAEAGASPRAFSALSSEDGAERDFLARIRANSVLIVPFVVLGRHYGSLVLASDTHDLSVEQWRMFGRALATQFGQTMALGQALATGAESDELFHAAWQLSPSGMLILNPAGEITLCNSQIVATFGYNDAELVGSPVELLLPAGLQAVRRAGVSRPPAGATSWQGFDTTTTGRHRDGREIPVEIGLVPIERSGGTSLLVSIVDITERKRQQQELSDTAARLQALMDNAADGIAVLSPGGVVVEANQRMADLLGISGEAIRGESIARLSSGGNYPEKVGEFADVVAAGGGRVTGVEILRPDHTTRIVDFSISVVRIADAALVLSIGRDVTEQRLVERQLTQAQRMESVGRLAGGIAHDFNNLLTAILGYTEMAIESLPPASDIRTDLAEVRKAADRAAGLTRQLLAFSRQQVLEPRVLNVNDVVHDIEKILRRVLGEDIELRTVLAPTVSNVLADPGQLEQVIMNLVVNARDAMPTGGKLTIETVNVELTEEYADEHQSVLPGSYVMLAVSDIGTGMTPDVQAHVFDPFFTTKAKDKGTGLGLSTVYGIVKQSGGYIWVYSEPGQGTAFKVYLPSVDQPLEESRPVADIRRSVTGTETVMLVEDEEALRRLARTILTELGYSVLDAGNADEALSIADRHAGPIHLLVTDVVMPGRSGRELARELSARRPGIQVLYLSGYTDDTIVRHGVLEAGVHFLQKPFTPADLAQKVRGLLDQSQAGRN